jgi:hypothetical protein
MPYLGISPTRTDNRKIDTPLQRVGGGVGFNGSATQFYLTIEGEPVYPDTELLFQAVLNGGQLNPKVDFTIQSNVITFAIAPSSGAIFFAILGDRVSLNKPGTDTVTTDTIKDGAVTTIKIADNSITSDKIAPGTVIASDVSDGAITTIKLDGTPGAEAVSTAKIRDLNITTSKLADLGVTTAKIADLNVTAGKIADSAVITAKIADSNITTSKLATDSVTADKIASGAVGTSELLNLSVTTNKIANDAITSTQIANGAVGTTELSTGAVTSDKINITVVNDPASPTDGQLIWNTFTNTAKIYNVSDSRWDELLTTTTGGSLVGWSFVSLLPSGINGLVEKNTNISPETIINSFASNGNFIAPIHVIVSNTGKISYSSNLNNWNAATSGTGNNINTVSWGGTFFFAGADSNTLLTSSSGSSWTVSSGPFSANGSNITASYYANNKQLIGSSLGNIASSSGSTTFTLRSSNLVSRINQFSYNNGVFVAAGSGGDIAISNDTTTWTKTLDIGGLKNVFVKPYGSGFIAVIDDLSNNNVTIKTSTNGNTWIDLIVNPPNITTINSLEYSSATQAYIIVDNYGISYRSVDGKNWSLFYVPSLDVGTSLESTELYFLNMNGIDYYITIGTKNISATLSPYFAISTFVSVNTNLQSNKNYIVDTSYGSITLDLPTNPKIGDIVRLADGANTWSSIPANINAGNKSFLVSTGVIDNTLILDFSGVNIDLVWTGTYWRLY